MGVCERTRQKSASAVKIKRKNGRKRQNRQLHFFSLDELQLSEGRTKPLETFSGAPAEYLLVDLGAGGVVPASKEQLSLAFEAEISTLRKNRNMQIRGQGTQMNAIQGVLLRSGLV